MNRLKTVASDTYGYDPANKRIWKNDEYTFYGAGGERIGRYSATKLVNDTGTHVLVFQKVQVDEYFGGRRLTTQDRLGSVGSYYPYGEAKSGTVSNADSFATYYRDSTGLDYADQRFYLAGVGRFTTADPYEASAGTASPGSWNRYSYVMSDPITFHDQSGLFLSSASAPPDHGPVISSYRYSSGGNSAYFWGGANNGASMMWHEEGGFSFDWTPTMQLQGTIRAGVAAAAAPPLGTKGARDALSNEACAKQLGFSSSAAAIKAFDGAKIKLVNAGTLNVDVDASGAVRILTSETSPFIARQFDNTIEINLDAGFINATDVTGTTQNGGTVNFNLLASIASNVGISSMSTGQYQTLITLHELRHYNSPQETATQSSIYNKQIWDACIK